MVHVRAPLQPLLLARLQMSTVLLMPPKSMDTSKEGKFKISTKSVEFFERMSFLMSWMERRFETAICAFSVYC
jgi:hypothetical protein